jgi:hypothetical protein
MILLFLAVVFAGNQGSAVQVAFANEPGVKAVQVVWQDKKVPAFRIKDTWTTILASTWTPNPGNTKRMCS